MVEKVTSVNPSLALSRKSVTGAVEEAEPLFHLTFTSFQVKIEEPLMLAVKSRNSSSEIVDPRMPNRAYFPLG